MSNEHINYLIGLPVVTRSTTRSIPPRLVYLRLDDEGAVACDDTQVNDGIAAVNGYRDRRVATS